MLKLSFKINSASRKRHYHVTVYECIGTIMIIKHEMHKLPNWKKKIIPREKKTEKTSQTKFNERNPCSNQLYLLKGNVTLHGCPLVD